MKSLIAVLLLTFSLAANALEVTGELAETEVQKWVDITCKVLEGEYDCPEGRPAVALAPLPRNTYGLYWGGNLIVMNEDLRNPQWGVFGESVLAHEIVHWIVKHNNREIGNCESEAIAYRISNAILKSRGRDDLIQLDWVKNYPDCQE